MKLFSDTFAELSRLLDKISGRLYKWIKGLGYSTSAKFIPGFMKVDFTSVIRCSRGYAKLLPQDYAACNRITSCGNCARDRHYSRPMPYLCVSGKQLRHAFQLK